MEQFEGRVGVVTGAGSGIGRALARRAAGEGMRVVIADVEVNALEEAAAEVETAGAEVVVAPTDVSRPEQVDALAGLAYERFGAVHLLCNNAGVFQGGITWQRELGDWEWVLGVNLWAVLHGVRAFVPRMLDGSEEGYIVNTSSVAGLITGAYSAPYITSKFAVLALTECLAHDLQAQGAPIGVSVLVRSEEHTSELQSHVHLVCRLLLAKKKKKLSCGADALRAEPTWASSYPVMTL